MGNIKTKRHFFNKSDYWVDVENKQVRLDAEFHRQLLNKQLWGSHGFKKVGGSSIGALVGLNKFSKPQEEILKLAWLKPDIYDFKYIDAGIAIEPLIVDAITKLKTKDGVVPKLVNYDGPSYNYNAFSELHNKGKEIHFGGLPDLVDFTDHTMYEIKTTGEKNIDKWDKFGVPKSYELQAMLYSIIFNNYQDKFTHIDKTKIVALFLKPEDYANPGALDVTTRVMKSYDIKMTLEEAMGYVKEAAAMRDQLVKTGTVKIDDISQEIMDWLLCENHNDWVDWEKKYGYDKFRN